jgi:hypothetical protein
MHDPVRKGTAMELRTRIVELEMTEGAQDVDHARLFLPRGPIRRVLINHGREAL